MHPTTYILEIFTCFMSFLISYMYAKVYSSHLGRPQMYHVGRRNRYKKMKEI